MVMPGDNTSLRSSDRADRDGEGTSFAIREGGRTSARYGQENFSSQQVERRRPRRANCSLKARRNDERKIRILMKAYTTACSTSRRAKSSIRQGTGARVADRSVADTVSRYTVLRSPHVDKKSREQFEMRTHKRLLDILEPTTQTVDALMKARAAGGCGREIKAFGK